MSSLYFLIFIDQDIGDETENESEEESVYSDTNDEDDPFEAYENYKKKLATYSTQKFIKDITRALR